MDEVDKHILQACRVLDCDFISEDEEISVAGFSTDNIVEFFVRALWSINPECRNELSSYKLPPAITARYRFATLISNYIQKSCARLDVGYQTILYGSISDLRRVFIALIERLPKGQNAADDEEDPLENFLARARCSLDGQPSWVPEFCRRLRMKYDGRFWAPGDEEPELFPLDRTSWNAIKTDPRTFLASLIRSMEDERLRNHIVKPAIGEKPKPQLAPKPKLGPRTSMDVVVETEEERQFRELTEELAQLDTRLQEEQSELLIKQAEMVENRSSLYATTKALSEYDDRFLSMLQNPDEGTSKIQGYLQEGEQRMVSLESRYEESRLESETRLAQLKEEHSAASDVLRLQKQIENSRSRAAELRSEKLANEILSQKLNARVAQLGSDHVDRKAITRRIMEMVETLRRQDVEIKKIIGDTTSVKKEIKWLSETLGRSFAVIEDTLFRDTNAPKGENAYRLFSKIHKHCTEGVVAIEKAGVIARKTEELRDKVDQEKQKQMELQLTRISDDLNNIVRENEDLARQLGITRIQPNDDGEAFSAFEFAY